MRLVNCIALALDGTWFTTEENIAAWRRAEPHIPMVKLGDKVTVQNSSILSFGVSGVVTGFDRSSSGKILLLVTWHKDAAPLRVSMKHLMPETPPKFWMVIPIEQRPAPRQGTIFNTTSRSAGIAPAVHRFETRQEALDYIQREREYTEHPNYVVLESVSYVTPVTVSPM